LVGVKKRVHRKILAMSYPTKATIFTIGGGHAVGGGGDGCETPSWAYILPKEWESASTASPEPEVKVGAKGFARDYGNGGVSRPMRVVAETLSGCVLVTFFDERAAQHTRRKDITRITRAGVKKGRDQVLPSPDATPFITGDKVWAQETGKGWKRGKVIEVFGAHQTALVKFYHETGFPSQNTLFSEISKEKPK
jgi:hypothetical protein